MNVFPLQNANSSVISVTGTASYVLPLIDSAGSVSHAFYPSLDALDITPENGDIRIMIDPSTGALAPTASKGFLIKQGTTLMLRHTSLRYIKVIATSGTVSCSLQVGDSEPGETTVVAGGGVGSGTSSIGKVEDAAHSSGDTGVFVLAKRTDTPTNSAGTDGDYSAINNDSLGHLWVREGFAPTAEDNTNSVIATVSRAVAVSTFAPTAVQSNSFTTTNAKASAGNVYGFSVINTSGSDRYLQFHNTATTPGGGATAAFKFLVPAGTMLVLSENDWGGPLTFTTGIAYANSTAAATYTAGTAGDLLLDLWYK